MLLATDKDRVKVWLKQQLSDTSHDTLLDQLIETVSVAMEGPELLNRPLLEAERTEEYALRRNKRHYALSLRAAPVLSSAAVQVKIDTRGDWESVSVEDASTYAVLADRGQIRWDSPVIGPSLVQVVYTAGMASDLDGLKATYPDLVQAATIWVGLLFSRRKDVGAHMVSVATPTGGARQKRVPALEHPPEAVMGLLRRYRRRPVGG